MLAMLKNWQGSVEVNGTRYDSVDALKSGNNEFSGKIHIKLYPRRLNGVNSEKNGITEEIGKEVYKVTVKQYMTKAASPEFDFMAKWNNNHPMPLRTMVGTVEKETKGMVYMNLHGQAEPVITCMRCGKTLTNPISRHYGIGPECLSKLGLIAEITDVENIKGQLVDIKWSGWIIKSAITEKEIIKED